MSSRASRWLIALLLVAGSAGCSSRQASGTAPTQLSDAASDLPLGAPPLQPTSVELSADVFAGLSPGCRGGRLMLQDVTERCRVSKGSDFAPEELNAELGVPEAVKAGEEVKLELRLVNRSQKPLALALPVQCDWYLHTYDELNADVIRHSYEDPGKSKYDYCEAMPSFVAVVLDPGGMLVKQVTWRADGERWFEDKLIEQRPLAPGTYTLRGYTGLKRSKPEELSGGMRMHDGLRAERSVVVR